MKTINYNELVFVDNDPFESGSFGTIKRCLLDGKIYMCKAFKDQSYLKGKKKKLDLLSKIDEDYIYVPKFWVKHNDSIVRYLTLPSLGKDIDNLKTESKKDKIFALKSAKQRILTMHKIGIIHSDISGSNLLIDQNNTVSAIDFDNCSYMGYQTNINHVNDYCQDFIKIYGIKPELDIFMFNLLTYYIMSDKIDYYMVRNNIQLNNYGIFNNPDGIKICKSLFLEDKIPNKDFLIDTIDETKHLI